MLGIENYVGFIIAALVLNITPGSDTIYMLSRTLAQGKRAGVASVLGISSGVLIWGLLVSFGLATLLKSMPSLMLLVKLLGAAYIVWIAIQMWRHSDLDAAALQAGTSHISMRKIYQQGIITNLLNPKVGLFFLAFLPQFVSTGTPSTVPFLLLTATFIATGTLWGLLLVGLASLISKQLQHKPQLAAYISRGSSAVLGVMGVHIGFSSLKEVL